MDINDNNAANFPVGIPLGVSGTTNQGYGQNGSLKDILSITSGSADSADKAMAFANQFAPLAPKADPWEAAFQFFAEMGKQASVPGSTALGAAVGSLQAPMDYLNAKKKERRESEAARTQMALTIGADLKSELDEVGGAEVQSSKILDSGVIVYAFKDGSKKVLNSLGEVVTGEAARTAIKEAEDRGTELQRFRAGGRRAGTISADIGKNAFEEVGRIRKNLVNLIEAQRLLRPENEGGEGANSGQIANLLPNWKASTIALENIKNNLGLDVIGSVTFGALSESELNMALSTALPTNMPEVELIQWLQDKIDAQNKLSEYLQDQAIFLSDGETTIGDWLRLQRDKEKELKLEEAERRQSGTNYDFSVMEAAELQEIDVSSLTDDQFDSWDARMDELGL